VEDSGIGVSGETQDIIFDRFTQADGSLTRRHEGAGLGLALARQLVTAMGGEMGLQSSPGQGSTFWFRLRLPFAASSIAAEISTEYAIRVVT
jgi:signal transduction histidine kinase